MSSLAALCPRLGDGCGTWRAYAASMKHDNKPIRRLSLSEKAAQQAALPRAFACCRYGSAVQKIALDEQFGGAHRVGGRAAA